MGLRNLFRKYKNKVDKPPCSPTKEKPKMLQQQQKENSNSIKSIDIDALP